MTDMTDRKYYIEFRVYLKEPENWDNEIVEAIADVLQNQLIDMVDPVTGAPPIFTQDVTYEVMATMTMDRKTLEEMN